MEWCQTQNVSHVTHRWSDVKHYQSDATLNWCDVIHNAGSDTTHTNGLISYDKVDVTYHWWDVTRKEDVVTHKRGMMSPINKCITSHITLGVISHAQNGSDVTIYMSLISQIAVGVVSHINIWVISLRTHDWYHKYAVNSLHSGFYPMYWKSTSAELSLPKAVGNIL